MTLRFARPRNPRTIDGLTPIDQDQLVAAAKAYDGRDCSAAECLPAEDDEESGLFNLEAWDVEDDTGAVVYNAWLYQVDSGTIFRAGTTTQVAAFIQMGLECDDDALAQALAAAARAHGAWPEGSNMKHMSLP